MKKVSLMINGKFSGLTEPKIGHKISFLCNGKGRGGHVRVTAEITKINSKTIAATESTGSYRPGTLWLISEDTEFSVREDSIKIVVS